MNKMNLPNSKAIALTVYSITLILIFLFPPTETVYSYNRVPDFQGWDFIFNLGGYLPTGYKKDENGILVPDDKEFEIVKSIFSLRKSGLKIRQISDVIKNKFGRKIHFTQCHRILNREYNQKLLNF